MTSNNIRFLRQLAKSFPNHRAVKTEIINLRAILALPKGTEFFLSDIHGEYDAFRYFVRSGSGLIRMRIEQAFSDTLSVEECDALASLIYDPENELKRRRKTESDFDEWCRKSIFRLIVICRMCSNKYTRSKVRRRLPDNSGYVMDELLFADDVEERDDYYKEIVNSIIQYDGVETFISELADVICSFAVDRLHIIGDIFDRGPKPHQVMDFLMEGNSVDIQWGNHDILWMGAACGNRACIANALRINIRYNNFDMLEYGYGLNLRPLATIAERIYGDDPCTYFQPNTLDKNRYDPIPEDLAAKMHKMMAIIQFKVEGQLIDEHPEYHLEDRKLLHKIDFEAGTVEVEGVTYPMRDMNLPTIDPADPYKLTAEEEEVMLSLEASILKSEKLQQHLDFFYSHGSLYKVCNGNVFYHGCIPMTAEGELEEIYFDGKWYKGAAYMDALERKVRSAYYDYPVGQGREEAASIMWFLWLAKESPLFGKDKMTTFERLFIDDKTTHKENKIPYYKLIDRQDICEKILVDFGLNPETGMILNGHVPVKYKDGEQPVKGGGKLLVIDGGISKAYQKTTGIAGYTAISTSKHFYLAEHSPYEPIDAEGNQVFHNPVMHMIREFPKRVSVKESDQGDDLKVQLADLVLLFEEYRKGTIEEVYPAKGKYYSK